VSEWVRDLAVAIPPQNMSVGGAFGEAPALTARFERGVAVLDIEIERDWRPELQGRAPTGASFSLAGQAVGG
jgi:hypothetical protein